MSNVPYFQSEEIFPRTWKINYAFTRPDTMPLYAYLVEGDDYAVVIDTMFGYGNLRAYCQTLTDRPLKLVNTHFHGDHTQGNFDFDACYIHPRDIPYLYSGRLATSEEIMEAARRIALPEYADRMEPSDFTAQHNGVRVYPIWDGDVFDLGGRRLEVIDVGGHSPGSIVLLDRSIRAVFTGDACNGNTLLAFGVSLSVEEYLENLLHFKRFQSEFDIMYGGHQIMPPSVLDEGIELCGRIIAGTDDKEERRSFGGTALYGAAHAADGEHRADGKLFNMNYRPEKILKGKPQPQVITITPPKSF